MTEVMAIMGTGGKWLVFCGCAVFWYGSLE
jgi:hypothetical protein